MDRKLAIYGAVIGDYYGSYWEFRDNKPKDIFDALSLRQFGHSYTDDTIMTCAIAKAVIDYDDDDSKNFSELCIQSMKEIGQEHPSSYGGAFAKWLYSEDDRPYYSFGNGSAMRISPVPLYADTLSKMMDMAHSATGVTHNHPFAIHYASLVGAVIMQAKRQGRDKDYRKEEMKNIVKLFSPNDYELIQKMTMPNLVASYKYTEKVQETVPQAVYCFLSSASFQDCLGRALLIGGDSDTLAAIACSMAAPFYGDEEVAPFLERMPKMPKELDDILKVFSQRYL